MQGAVLAVLVGAAVRVPVDLAHLVTGTGIGMLLTVLAMMAGAGAAVLAGVSALLVQSTQLGRLALWLGGYSLVVLPLTSGLPSAPWHSAAPVVLLVVWAVPAGGYLGVGVQRRCHGLSWVGCGIAVVGLAHVQNDLAAPTPSGSDLVFGALRLLGLLVVAAGVIVLARNGQRALREQRRELASRLAMADEVRVRLADRAAHRDHEFRNGLCGLSGISELVEASAPTRDREWLRAAVDGQITRLEALLDDAEDTRSATDAMPRPGG